MAAPFRQRLPISGYAARVILWHRGTILAENGRSPADGLVTPARHRGLSQEIAVMPHGSTGIGAAGTTAAPGSPVGEDWQHLVLATGPASSVDRAGAHGVCPVAQPERAALAGGPVLRRAGTRPGAGVNRPGPYRPAHAAVRGGHGPAGRLDLEGSRAAGQQHPRACRHACEHPVKRSRPQPEASAALLEDLLMAGYLGGTRLGAQLHNLAHGTVCRPASGCPACGSARPGPHRPPGITARPQPTSGK